MGGGPRVNRNSGRFEGSRFDGRRFDGGRRDHRRPSTVIVVPSNIFVGPSDAYAAPPPVTYASPPTYYYAPPQMYGPSPAYYSPPPAAYAPPPAASPPPPRSEISPMIHGEAASPSRWISIVVTAKPRARSWAGSTLAIAALSGPMLKKSSTSVTNIAGQKTAGCGARMAKHVKTMEATSDKPDSVKSAPGHRLATPLAMRPPSSVPMKPAATRMSPKVDAAVASGMPRSRTK